MSKKKVSKHDFKLCSSTQASLHRHQETKYRNTALPQGKRIGESHYMFIMYPGKGKPELLVFSLPERKEEMATSHCWQKHSIPSIPKRLWLYRIFSSSTVKQPHISVHWPTIYLLRTSESRCKSNSSECVSQQSQEVCKWHLMISVGCYCSDMAPIHQKISGSRNAIFFQQ